MEKKVAVQEAKKLYKDSNGKVIDDTVDGFVVMKNINKVYNNRVQAVFHFNLSIKRNEFIVLVGPSGCGKSTTLRMIAGLEEITDGKLYIDHVYANYLESKNRDIAMVFQSYALYPNMSVYDNIAFSLQVRGMAKDVIKEKVFKAAEILDLGAYLDRKPKELSGGQMQRVALGRAIVRDAKLFLMDEPLSNLDAKLRVHMRSEIVKLHRDIHATTIYVTHDQTEAMTMADRIVIMNKGIVQQIGSPIEVYNNPANVFVATFIGNPPMNVFKADISKGKIYNGKDFLTLPPALIESYKQFILSRRKFFDELKIKAQFTRESELIQTITVLKKELKKLNTQQISDKLRQISDEMIALSNEKGFIDFTEENAEVWKNDAINGSIANVRQDLNQAAEVLNNSGLAVAGILKEVSSSGIFGAQKEQIKPAANRKKQPQESLIDENSRKIEEYILAYGNDDVLNNALVGIRPEDIYFSDTLDGKVSEPFNSEAQLVEILGSDYCMHVKAFGANLIIKRAVREVVKSGDKVKLCFDMDKVKIFDSVSGKVITV